MAKWYEKGLKFKCTGCGKCCTGGPGVVWVTDEEIAAIAKHLKCPIEVFKTNFTRIVDGRRSLNEKINSYDCQFLKDKKCQIYPVRPKQCRTYPWWPENIQNRQTWNALKTECEGVEHPDAEIVPFAEIEKNLKG